MLISHRSPLQLTTSRLPGSLKSEIGHHRGHQALVRQRTAVLQHRSPEVEHVVTINNPAATIHSQHPIGITIEGEPHGRTAFDHRLAQRSQMGGSTAHIDLFTICLSMQHGEVGPK